MGVNVLTVVCLRVGVDWLAVGGVAVDGLAVDEVTVLVVASLVVVGGVVGMGYVGRLGPHSIDISWMGSPIDASCTER